MRKQRVLLLLHPKFHPDRHKSQPGTEFDVWKALSQGHHVDIVSAHLDIRKFDRQLAELRPDVVFNLLEEFRGEAAFDFHLVGFLESLGIPVTGCNPRGLIFARNKGAVSHIARGLGVECPNGETVSRIGDLNRSVRKLKFPLFVKLNREDASFGIRESNRVASSVALKREFLRMRSSFEHDVMIQEFIPGYDVSVAAMGNRKPRFFRPRRMSMRVGSRVQTAKLKFSVKEQRRQKARSTVFAGESWKRIVGKIGDLYQTLDLSGYSRLDFRVSMENCWYLIDVNANPNLAKNEDFALSAKDQGIGYPELLDKIMQMAKSYQPYR